MKQARRLAILVLALSLVVCWARLCQSAEIGTAFTYQGRLIDANDAAEGLYDFAFKLYDANIDGNQVGSDVNKPDVGVTDGYFTVELDFGSGIFTGEARWLQIGVRLGDSSGAFTTLSPRQKITAVPYAISTASQSGTSNAFVTGYFHDHGIYGPSVPHPIQVDLSSLGNISPNDVTIVTSAFKYDPSVFFDYEAAFVRWEITGPPLAATLRVYDKQGVEYDPYEPEWINHEMFMSFIAAGPNGGIGIPFSNSKVVGGRISGVPPATYPFESDISGLGDVEASDVMVVASGSKLTAGGVPETPIMIKWDVNESPLTLKFRVWDTSGNEYSPAAGSWLGRHIDMSFAAFDPNGDTVSATEEKVVIDLNLDNDANIVTGEIPQEDYYGTVTRLYLRDLPNLKERLGGSGITLVTVNDTVKKLMLSAETYSDAAQGNLTGFRWARVNGDPTGTDETDIYWPIKIYEDVSGATEDTSATYKLIRVEAHLE